MAQEERRSFSRVPFTAGISLVDQAGTTHAGRLHDIALKGALVEIEDPWRPPLGARCRFRLQLSPQVSIRMQMTVMHAQARRIGLRCDAIDLDSITALRRLVSLNAGDPRLLERELRALITREPEP